MATPNQGKTLNFIPKIYDETKQDWVPFYIAPDATDVIQGDVKLSDSTDSSLDAATGMTAATPKAIKTVQDNANNKVDKVSNTEQIMAANLTSRGKITADTGFSGNLTGNVTGNVSGNSGTTDKLKTPVTISIKSTGNNTDNASAVFDGSGDIVITLNKVAASLIDGLLNISNIPPAALERLIPVENQTARFALTTDNVQIGDTVHQLDTGIMYLVVDVTNLGNENGYREYSAGLAASVPWTGVTGTSGAITNENLSDNIKYAASSEKGGSALAVTWHSF